MRPTCREGEAKADVYQALLDRELTSQTWMTWKAMENLVHKGLVKSIGTTAAPSQGLEVPQVKWQETQLTLSSRYFQFQHSQNSEVARDGRHQTGCEPSRTAPIPASERIVSILSGKRDSRHRTLASRRSPCGSGGAQQAYPRAVE